jgi:hypothetical protein
MLLTPKVVIAFLDSSPSGKTRTSQAASLAKKWAAHLVGVRIAVERIEWPFSVNYVRGERGVEDVVAYQHQLESEQENNARQVAHCFRELCREMNIHSELHQIGRDRSAAYLLGEVYLSDLAVAGQPDRMAFHTSNL